jgi:hypothetical protein
LNFSLKVVVILLIGVIGAITEPVIDMTTPAHPSSAIGPPVTEERSTPTSLGALMNPSRLRSCEVTIVPAGEPML